MKSNLQRILYIVTLIQLGVVMCSNAAEPLPRDLSYVKLPDGFYIEVFAQVPNARQIVRSNQNTIFVSTRSAGKVYAIKDTDGDNKADVIKILAENLTMPNGVALKDGTLYVAEVSRILRFDDIQNNLDTPTFVVVKDGLPTETHHGWKFIDFGPDGKLYIPIGAPCNICDKGDPYATINRMDKDGSNFEIYARGVRNTVGFDWDPKNNQLWFTENGRDDLGNDIPPDELNYAPQSLMHFGYPYCHGTNINDPQFGKGIDCKKYVAPKY